MVLLVPFPSCGSNPFPCATAIAWAGLFTLLLHLPQCVAVTGVRPVILPFFDLKLKENQKWGLCSWPVTSWGGLF